MLYYWLVAYNSFTGEKNTAMLLSFYREWIFIEEVDDGHYGGCDYNDAAYDSNHDKAND